MMKHVELNDTQLFDLKIGRRILQANIFGSKEKIPLFSANVFKEIGFLEDSNLSDFDNDYILWGIDGHFQINFKHKKEIFATTDHCGTIEILDSKILPEYLVYQLKRLKHELGFNRMFRPSLSNMRKLVSVKIPTKKDGSFDKDQQLKLVEKYNVIEKIKQDLLDAVNMLENTLLEIPHNKKTKLFSVESIFDFPVTNSEMTRRFCNDNPGDIPVYGCSKDGTLILGNIKKDISGIKYYENCLAWNRNGSVGKFFYRTNKFSTNEDHRTLELKDEFKDKICLNFMKHELQKEVKKLGFSFTKKLGKANLAPIEVKIPVDDSDNILLDTQKEIAEKYEKLYDVKSKLIQEIQKLLSTTVKLE